MGNDFAYNGFLKGSGTIYETVGKESASSKATTIQPTKVKLKTDDTKTIKEIKFASWGVDNDEPIKIITAIEAVPMASRALLKKVESAYGLGPFVYELDETDDGKEVIKPIRLKDKKDLKAFLKKIRINKTAIELLNDCQGLGNGFIECIVSNDYKTIISARHQEAKFCRISVREKGVSKWCGISSEWGTDKTVSEENCTTVRLVDPYLSADEIRKWCEKYKVKKFIYPVAVPSLGKTYYQKPAHESARTSGWLDIAKRIPETILSMLKNSKRIQWHVKIPYEYWEKEFPIERYIDSNDEKKGKKKRQEDMEAKLKELDDFLSGSGNAGKTFYSGYGQDPITKKEFSEWKFEQLDASMKFDKDIVATSTANSEIAIAWGVDPALVGMNQLGQKNGAGSGSDKREADEIMKSDKTVADMVSEPFEFIFEFNGYGEDLKLGFKKQILTTLDKNPTGSQKAGV